MVLGQQERAALQQDQRLLVAQAHEEERVWVASELHDDVLQRIALVCADLDGLRPADGGLLEEAMEQRLRGLRTELMDLAVVIRRIAVRLHPTAVDHVGLVPALEELGRETAKRGTTAVHIWASGLPDDLAVDTARAAYRIAQEGLRNVLRHADSRTATVTVTSDGSNLVLIVQDQGRGFETTIRRRGGLGLAVLHERAQLVGGTVDVRSRSGHGTVVTATLPLRRPTTAS